MKDFEPTVRPNIPASSRPWGQFTLMLLTPEELLKLPNGSIVIDIFGIPCIKTEKIDTDTRGGVSAYGFLIIDEAEDK
jgi:hypothetical protein